MKIKNEFAVCAFHFAVFIYRKFVLIVVFIIPYNENASSCNLTFSNLSTFLAKKEKK